MKEKKPILTRLRLKKKYAVLLLVLGGISLFALILGISYAFFTTQVTGSNMVVYTGNLEVNYTKTGNLVNLSDTYPMTNSQGLSTEGYTFNITNTGTIDAKYLIRLELDSDNTVPIEYVKLSYNKTKQNNNTTDNPYIEPVLVSNLNSSLIFASDQVIESGKMDSYNLKLWIDYSAPNSIQGKTFKAKITVDAIQNVDKGYALANTVPIITLDKYENGEIDAHLKVNDTFTDPGIESVRDDKDKLTEANVTKTYKYTNDGENLTTVSGVDTTTAGVYYIDYEVTDSDNLVGRATRVVTVNPTTTPAITLNGNNPMTLTKDATFTDPGATVAAGNHVATIGEVKTSAPGTYILRYIVIDRNGNVNSVTRTLTVIDQRVLNQAILADNTLITAAPTLTTASSWTSDASGLYKMGVTNGFGGANGDTYYFRGNVNSNKVKFAGLDWRIVRINEDGTVRLILDGPTDTSSHKFNSNYNNFSYMYYSNSQAKSEVEAWYNANITENNASKVATGNYFCEAAKVKYDSDYTSGSATMTVYSSYTPDLKCQTDGNAKGLLNNSVGLINYDEVVLAGGYSGHENSKYYLYNEHFTWWTMSPTGFVNIAACVWVVDDVGGPYDDSVSASYSLRPVINLKTDTLTVGTGTEEDPYVIQ